MISKEKIARINSLAKKSKIEELSAEEKSEQSRLRAEYIAAFRSNLKSQLQNIEFVD